MNTRFPLLICLAVACGVAVQATPAGSPASVNHTAFNSSAPQLLADGFQGLAGSTIGPDGRLYVTEPATGRILRVNPRTGSTTVFASGLPPSLIGLGGAMDVAFIGNTAYALVTLVGPDVGGTNVVGIYRVDRPNTFTVVADIGDFSIRNPPKTAFDVPSGLQYAMEAHDGGFLVSDGHHNRVLKVALNGRVREVIGFDNIVPTGLAVSGPLVFVAQAGPVPHLPEDGRIAAFLPRFPFALEIASGARLLVDVEIGPFQALYGLSQGEFPVGSPPATPALPNTGALVKVNHDGTFRVVTPGLNQPTSLEIIGDTAYVVSLAGEIWKIDHVR